MSYCQKKKRQKLRGREFRLITVTGGMMPIGMQLKFKNSCRPKKVYKIFIHQIWWRQSFWDTGIFTTLKHLHFTLTGQGGQWTGEFKCYFGKINEKLVSLMHFPQPHISVGTAVHLELQPVSGYFLFIFFKQIILVTDKFTI